MQLRPSAAAEPRRALLSGALCLVLAAAGGCSPTNNNRAPVKGMVRVDGEPLVEGSIAFFPAAGNKGPSAGAVILEGKYEIPREKGAVLGPNRVEIRGFRNSGRKIPDIWHPGEMLDEKVSAVAPQYNSQSTLVEEIRAEVNTLDFDLTGTGGS